MQISEKVLLFSFFVWFFFTNCLTEAGTFSWSSEQVHTFLKTWGEENDLKIKSTAAGITGFELWYLLPSELVLLFSPDPARIDELGQKLFDKLHSFAVSTRRCLFSPSFSLAFSKTLPFHIPIDSGFSGSKCECLTLVANQSQRFSTRVCFETQLERPNGHEDHGERSHGL